MTVLRYKSAKYSIERPLQIGAALAGGGSDMLAALSHFGLPLGEAFQLRDDLLGVFGDPEVTGKPAGDDLVEGKRTVLVALTLDAAPPMRRARSTDASAPPVATRGGRDLRGIIDRSGAHAQVEAVIDAARRAGDRGARRGERRPARPRRAARAGDSRAPSGPARSP